VWYDLMLLALFLFSVYVMFTTLPALRYDHREIGG
jgi:hypothetical protein